MSSKIDSTFCFSTNSNNFCLTIWNKSLIQDSNFKLKYLKLSYSEISLPILEIKSLR